MKVEQEVDRQVAGESQSFDRCDTGIEQNTASTSRETAANSSHVSSIVNTEKTGYDQLPKEMNEMKIRDLKDDNYDDKVKVHS